MPELPTAEPGPCRGCGKVNVDDSPKLQQRFSVQAIPTLMVLRRGQVAVRRAGAAPVSDLRAWVEEAIKG